MKTCEDVPTAPGRILREAACLCRSAAWLTGAD